MEAEPPAEIISIPTLYKIARSENELFGWYIPELSTRVSVTPFCKGAANNPNPGGAESIRVEFERGDLKPNDKARLGVFIQSGRQNELRIMEISFRGQEIEILTSDFLQGPLYTLILFTPKGEMPLVAEKYFPCPHYVEPLERLEYERSPNFVDLTVIPSLEESIEEES